MNLLNLTLAILFTSILIYFAFLILGFVLRGKNIEAQKIDKRL